jgi:hypothetical protein
LAPGQLATALRRTGVLNQADPVVARRCAAVLCRTNAGTRCAGYEGTCESVLAGAPLKKANGTATNATKEADAAPAVAAAPKDATKSSALTAVASALLPLAAGAAVLLAL